MKRPILALLLLSGCLSAEIPEDDIASAESLLTPTQRRARVVRIRDAASAAGLTEGYLLAGIGDAETQLSQCWSELTWACKGPASADCGGGPVVAGAGDGPCSLKQGGLGIFQFDAGTHSQTLAREGDRVLTVEGNVAAAVDFVVNMVIRSAYISNVSTRAEALSWINGVRLTNSRFPVWIKTVTHYYNGCSPTGCSVYNSRYERYRSHTVNIYNEMGVSFWGETSALVEPRMEQPTQPTPPAGPSVREIGNRLVCESDPVRPLGRQLADFQSQCVRPGEFVRFDAHRNVILQNGTNTMPYIQKRSRDAIWGAADAGHVIRVNWGFRSIAEQYVLRRSVGHPGGCSAAAAPGRSNHQGGRAFDVSNYQSLISPLESRGCRWLGRTVRNDPYHFDCPGSDLRTDSVLAFQMLWNINNPSDRITADGLYGPQTQSRLERSPANGFSITSCDGRPAQPQPSARCDGDRVIGADGTITDCGLDSTCSTALGDPTCVSSLCVGSATERPRARTLCSGNTAISCDTSGFATPTNCVDGCVEDANGARCQTPLSCARACKDGGIQNEDCTVTACGFLGICNDSLGAPQCMSNLCVTEQGERPRPADSCIVRTVLVSCDEEGQATALRCGSACQETSATDATCVGGSTITSLTPEDHIGGGELDESSLPDEVDPVDPKFAEAGLTPACSVHPTAHGTQGLYLALFIGLIAVRRRRTKKRV